MKKIMILLVMLIPALTFAQKKYENSFLTMNIPDGWMVQNMDVSAAAGMEMLLFMNEGDNIYNIGMVIGQKMVQDPKYVLQNQMEIKSNMLFQNATFDEIRPSSFMGRKAVTADFSTTFLGTYFKGATYCFNKDDCTIVIIGCYKVGVKSNLPQIWKSIQWKKVNRTASYKTLREEVQDYCVAMNELLSKNTLSATGEEQVISFELEEGQDCLIYTYKLLTLDKNDYTEEQINLMRNFVREAVIPEVKKMGGQTELIKRCMQNDYIFKYVYLDKNDEFFYSVKITPDDYNE